MNSRWLVWALLGSVLLVGCGFRTAPSPKPQQPELITFDNPRAQHFGNRIRLSWRLKDASLLQAALGEVPEPSDNATPSQAPSEEAAELNRPLAQSFVIEEWTQPEVCIGCKATLERELTLPLPSPRITIEGNQAYFYPPAPLENDLRVRLYRIRHVNAAQGEPSRSDLLPAGPRVRFAQTPQLRLEVAQTETLSEAMSSTSFVVLPQGMRSLDFSDLRLLRLRWEPVAEKVSFRWQNEQFLEHNQQWYRVFIYRSSDGKTWPETPLIAQPLNNTFVLLPDSRTQPAHYRIRWVDQQGNESPPSNVVTHVP
jgi:hypothetical protein